MKKLVKLFSLLVVFVAVVALTSCAPSSIEKAKEKLEKDNYTVVATTYDEVGENGEVGIVSASVISLTNGKTCLFTLYKTSKQAKAAYNDSKNAEGDTSCVLIGKWVAVGNEDIIKAFKK